MYRLKYRNKEIKKIAGIILADIEEEYNPVFKRLDIIEQDK